MVSEEIYSEELKEVSKFLEEVILVEHPTTTVTVPYFILSIISVRTSKAFSIFERMMTSASLETIYVSILEDIHKSELMSMRPNKRYQLGQDLIDLLESANKERLLLNADKLTSEHVILALLKEDTPIKKKFDSFGIGYSQFLSKMMDNQETILVIPEGKIRD